MIFKIIGPKGVQVSFHRLVGQTLHGFFTYIKFRLKNPGPWVLKWGWSDRMEACKCSENVDLEAKIRGATCVFDSNLLDFLNNLSTMGATFANSLPPSPSPHHLLDFEKKFVRPHPQPSHTHPHTHAHARTHAGRQARTHTQRVWKNTLQNLQCFLLIANENDKGLLDTTRYNS